MIRVTCCKLTLISVLLGAALLPAAAWGQAGFYLTPSLSVAEVYDDNVFFDASREGDFISRFTPSIEAGYRSAPLTLLGYYSFDAEVFARLTDQTDAQARQRASAELRYLPSRLLTLALITSYVETQTPEDVNEVTGVEFGRQRATSLTVNPSVTYRFSRLVTGDAGYAFTRTEQAGTTNETHAMTLGLSRRLSPRDTVDLGTIIRYFQFEDEITGDDSVTSYAFTVGWSRRLTQLSSLELRAGPRFTDDGDVGAEILAALRHRLKHGTVALRYVRTQGTISGTTGTVTSDIVGADLTYQLWRRLQMVLGGSFSRNSGAEDTENYRANLGVTYQVGEYVSLLASYRFTFQRGRVETTAFGMAGEDEDVYRNIFLLQLVISRSYRVY